MKIVINTYYKNTIALNHLLESMQQCEEYNNYEIIVISGGFYNLDNYEIKKNNNLTMITCNHNSIDFTGLITLLELFHENEDDYYFYMHDTCKVGNNFYKKLKSINLSNVSSIRIYKGDSMNIGVYSQKIINTFKDFLLSKKNTDEKRCAEFKVNSAEDHIFKNDSNNIVLDNFEGSYIIDGPCNYYSSGVMRRVEYYPNIDIYKFKANYGQLGWDINCMILNA